MPTVTCKHCRGRGRIQLTGLLAETYDLLRRQRHPISGADLAREMGGCTIEAMANRLQVLSRYGLTVFEEYGRCKLWRVK